MHARTARLLTGITAHIPALTVSFSVALCLLLCRCGKVSKRQRQPGLQFLLYTFIGIVLNVNEYVARVSGQHRDETDAHVCPLGNLTPSVPPGVCTARPSGCRDA